ncbi:MULTISPECIES: hypothetical protein [unclassified Gordonia (in: high G+C Gram-positive bacteria)]|uniref:hypothetical protein n=1 Tax=unclassified Gordonia (in: high G+C Gram-positive bacteria) TaxID=2657482 RepID=UPI001CFA6170|nr:MULTISPECIES: hypothetical protein [unclassified Gordonia (in: high G+C Gram-positive bacteria)]MCT1353842.1 hypothetical protein [Gordonia sp. p3-SID1431]UCZ91270.1 hypothetical protein LEL84_06320 [Gordonia sp. WA4-43]
MTTSHGGYPPPDDEDDDQIAAQFLDVLRARLDAAGEYGSVPWRTERDAQIQRLASLGWTDADLAAHYRIGRDTVRAARVRHASNTTRPDPATIRRHSYLVRIPDYAIDLAVDHDTATRLHSLINDYGIDAQIVRHD